MSNNDMTEADARWLAEEIADDLTTSGGGRKADHLKLYAGIDYLGGWGREPLAERIYRKLMTSAPAQELGMRGGRKA